MDSIHEEERGGECSRCHTHKPGVKVFLLQSNPSYSWSPPRDLTAQSMPDVTNWIVCKDCLTDEEIARLLTPVAIFVLSQLFIYNQSSVSQSASHVKAALTVSAGDAALPDRKNREKALEALG